MPKACEADCAEDVPKKKKKEKRFNAWHSHLHESRRAKGQRGRFLALIKGL